MRTRRRAWLLVTGALAAGTLLAPAAAHAARVGPPLPQASPHFQTCVYFPAGCSFANYGSKFGTTRVPFDGRVRRWRVQAASGEVALQVLKRRSDGSFRALRTTPTRTVSFGGDDAVRGFGARLRVRRGHFLALRIGQGSELGAAYETQTCFWGFIPAPADGQVRRPNEGYSGCGAYMLFNARVVR